ncbi:MAG: hypothetical protein JO021_05455 [Alphaproteobacteria bacterium]|nr:hypothetical protein [Alphaproteobacteria bacterium]
MTIIPFAEWRPDMPALGPWAREAKNVVPDVDSYRPLNALSGVSNALASRAQGAAWFRGTAGATRMFAGDASTLYLLNNSTWTPVPQLAAPRTVTAITRADPGQLTATAHGYATGDTVYVSGVVGMTEINGQFLTVTVVDADTFTVGIDTTGYSAYISGGTAQKATVYSPGGDGSWRFTQFGALALAVNGVDPPQKFDLAVGTNFAALGGKPPVAAFVTTVRDFVLMGKIGSTPQRIQWSGLNNCEIWGSIPVSQADFQDLPDGGNVTGLVGGELGVVLQETAVRRLTYEGSPVVFRIDKIATDIGCSVPNSLASLLDLAFFLHKSGFYMIQGGQAITPIGRGKVDRTFWAEFDESNHFRSSAAIDPVRGLYVFAYPANGSNGIPNRLLIYNWTTQRWSRAVLGCELIFGGVSQQAYALEQLDSLGTLETLPYSLDSSYWSGTVSLLLFGFDVTHRSGSFSGATLDAVCETGEFNPGAGQRSVIRGCRPLIDGGAPLIELGVRETQQATASYGPPIGLTPAGMAPVYGSGRYFRARATIPAGSTWQNMQGIDDLDVRPAGTQ